MVLGMEGWAFSASSPVTQGAPKHSFSSLHSCSTERAAAHRKYTADWQRRTPMLSKTWGWSTWALAGFLLLVHCTCAEPSTLGGSSGDPRQPWRDAVPGVQPIAATALQGVSTPQVGGLRFLSYTPLSDALGSAASGISASAGPISVGGGVSLPLGLPPGSFLPTPDVTVGVTAAHVGVQDAFLRWDFNLTFGGSDLPAPSDPSPFLPYKADWLAVGNIGYAVNGAIPSSLPEHALYTRNGSVMWVARDVQHTDADLNLPSPANIAIQVHVEWTVGHAEPTVSCAEARVWRGWRWAVLDATAVCSGMVMQHPVLPTGPRQPSADAGSAAHPRAWQAPVHAARVVLHMPLQETLLDPTQVALWQNTSHDPNLALRVQSSQVVGVASLVNASSWVDVAEQGPVAWQGLAAPGPVASFPPLTHALRPATAGVVLAVSGHSHGCSIFVGGGVKCYGVGGPQALLQNGAGRLGYGSTDNVGDEEPLGDIPFVSLPGPARALSLASMHTCTVLHSGQVMCWGWNGWGQCGRYPTSSTTNIGDDELPTDFGPVPLPASAGLTIHVATSDTSTCALNTLGQVHCWGQGNVGQLGDGTSTGIREAAQALPALLSAAAVDIQGGHQHYCALLITGHLQCWGSNKPDVGLTQTGGQLGLGHIWNVNDPSAVGTTPLGMGRVLNMAVGSMHACVVGASGGALCFGGNVNGFLVTSISLNGDDPTSDNVLYGRLGLAVAASIGDDETAEHGPVVRLPAPITSIACGELHNCAVVVGGDLYCWGILTFGEGGSLLGSGEAFIRVANDGSSGQAEWPGVPVGADGPVLLQGGAVAAAPGFLYTSVLMQGGALTHMGMSLEGRGGLGKSAAQGQSTPLYLLPLVPQRYDATPTIAASLALRPPRHADSVSISGWGGRVCVLREGGRVSCWGSGDGTWPYLGLPQPFFQGDSQHIGDDEMWWQAPSVPLPEAASQVSVGQRATCAILRDSRRLVCWGYIHEAAYGGQGVPWRSLQELPLSVRTPPFVFGGISGEAIVDVRVGDKVSCVLNAAGRVRCWGDSAYGCLGHPTADLAALHNSSNVLGLAHPVTAFPPLPLAAGIGAPPDTLSAVAAGNHFACAVTVHGNVTCWGRNHHGQLGYGNTVNSADRGGGHPSAQGYLRFNQTFARVPAVRVSTGDTHACVVFADGGVQCWGQHTSNNGFDGQGKAGVPLQGDQNVGHDGQLQYDTNGNVCNSMTQYMLACMPRVRLSGPAIDVFSGSRHTCALLQSGHLQCWGEGVSGGLVTGGTASVGDIKAPAEVGVAGLPPAVRSVATPLATTCVVLWGGAVKCFGFDEDGLRGRGTTTSTGTRGIARHATHAAQWALDLSGYLTLAGISTRPAVVGSRGAWRSITQVHTCVTCNMAELPGLPPWLFASLHGADEVSIPLPQAALGIPCTIAGMPTQEGSGVCTAWTGCSAGGGGTQSAVQAWSTTCAWPDTWVHANGTLAIHAAMDAALPLDTPPGPDTGVTVASQGGTLVRLWGVFWALSIVSSTSKHFTITVGGAACTAPSLVGQGGRVLHCLAPPLPSANVSGGVPILLHHTVPGLPSPIAGTTAAARLQYEPPQITAAIPSAGLSITGQDIQLRGFGLGQATSALAAAAVPFQLPLNATAVWVHTPANSTWQVTGQCALLGASRLSGLLHCRMPPGTGTVGLTVSVAGQESWPPVTVQYATPSIEAVEVLGQEAVLVWGARGTAAVAIHGANLGLANSSVHASVGGAQCGSATVVNASYILCSALPLSDVERELPLVDTLLLRGGGDVAARLPASAPVLGQPLLTGVLPFPADIAGQVLTLFGLRLATHVGQVAAVTLGPHNASCVPLSAASTGASVQCQLPPGLGPLTPIHFTRRGGASATLVEAPAIARYAAPVVTQVQPASVFARPTAGQAFLNVTLSGSSLAVAGVDFSHEIRICGVPCPAVQAQAPGQLLCAGLDAAALQAPATARAGGQASANCPVQLSMLGQVVATAPAPLTVLLQPSISAVQPSTLSTAGGALTVFGSNFAAELELDGVRSVTVGSGPCTGVVVTSPGTLTCTAPTWQAAGGAVGLAPVTVTLVSGGNFTLASALRFASPEIIQVSGTLQFLAAPSSPTTSTISFIGPVLADPDQPSTGQEEVFVRDADGETLATCSGMGGTMRARQVGSSVEASCTGFREAALPPVPAGDVVEFALVLRTHTGIDVTAQSAHLLVHGPPLVTRVSPAQGFANTTRVTLSGANFGAIAAHIARVSVGALHSVPFEWGGGTSILLHQGVPAQPDGRLDALPITVHTAGQQASLPASAGVADFSYQLPLQPPTASPTLFCAQQSPAGVLSIVLLWPGDRVTRALGIAAWTVHVQPWTGNATVRGSAEGRATFTLQGDAGVEARVQTLATLPAACGTRPRDAIPAGPFLQLSVEHGLPGAVSVGVAAGTALGDRRMDGPPAWYPSPVLPTCGPSDMLATYHLLREPPMWSSVLCQPCPAGALCDGLPWEGMRNAAGFYRVPWSEAGLAFLPCSLPEACPEFRHAPLPVPAWLGALWERCNGGWRCTPTAMSPLYRHDSQAVNVSMAVATPEAFLLGGPSSAPTSTHAEGCATGHTGLRCSSCSLGYGRAGTSERCEPCSSGRAAALAVLMLVVVGGSALICFLARFYMNTMTLTDLQYEAGGLQKILLNHLQQTSLMLQFQLAWPDPLASLMTVSDIASSASTAVLSPECARESAERGDWTAFQIKTAVTFAFPLAFLGCVLTVLAVLVVVGRMDFRAARRRFLLFFFVTAFLLYTGLIRATTQLFSCETVAGHSVLTADPDTPCDASTAHWRLGIGVPASVLFLIGFPLALHIALRWQRSKLFSSPKAVATLGFTYLGYTKTAFGYEVVVMARKAALATLLIVLRPFGLLPQVAFAAVTLTAALGLSSSLQPFVLRRLNHLEAASLHLSVLTLCGGVLLQAAAEEPATAPIDPIPISVFLTVCNALFLLVCLFFLVKRQSQRFNRAVNQSQARVKVAVRRASIAVRGPSLAKRPGALGGRAPRASLAGRSMRGGSGASPTTQRMSSLLASVMQTPADAKRAAMLPSRSGRNSSVKRLLGQRSSRRVSRQSQSGATSPAQTGKPPGPPRRAPAAPPRAPTVAALDTPNPLMTARSS